MLSNVFGFVVALALTNTHDYDEKDFQREQMLKERNQGRHDREIEEYRQQLISKVNKYFQNVNCA